MASKRCNSESVASDRIPVQCSQLRKGAYVMLKEKPCKIVDMKKHQTGKHGHTKIHIVGLDIFKGERYEAHCQSTHNIDVPVVRRVEYQVVGLSSDNYFTLMSETGELHHDLRLEPAICNTPRDVILQWWNDCEDKDDVILTARTVYALGCEEVAEVKKKVFKP